MEKKGVISGRLFNYNKLRGSLFMKNIGVLLLLLLIGVYREVG